MLFNIKTLFVVIALVVIVTESKPNAAPQEESQELIIEELPPLDDDTHIDADSFPLAHDFPQGIDGVDDYHIRK